MEFVQEDANSLLAQLKHEDKRLNIKRRWLMGLTISTSEEEKLMVSTDQTDRVMPELILREDDVFFESIKRSVEEGLGTSSKESIVGVESCSVQDAMQFLNSRKDMEGLLSRLDDMTNEGLCRFADVLTNGSIKFAKTRQKIRKIIKDYLPEMVKNQRDIQFMELSKVLMDPCNFHSNKGILLTFGSFKVNRDAVTKVLDGLEDLPTLALASMHRKLRGFKGYMPQLKPSDNVRRRDMFINRIRKVCTEMLSSHDEQGAVQEPLAKAMAVASLTLKHLLHYPLATEFQHFSREIEALHFEISNGISLLKKMRFSELKKLQHLVDPDAKLSRRSLRPAIRNLLIQFLFECNDMEIIPEYLPLILAIINKKSLSSPHGLSSKEEVEEEVECVLKVSAHAKQVLWDLLPEHEFDQEFANAYMDEPRDSDEDDYGKAENQRMESLQNTGSFLDGKSDQHEGVGETTSPSGRSYNDYHIQEEPKFDSKNTPEFVSSRCVVREARPLVDEERTSRNQYLAVQEACDRMSLFTYRFVGNLLDGLAHREGLELEDLSYLRSCDTTPKKFHVADEEKISDEENASGLVFMQVLEELVPSFPKSGKDRAKELMGLK